MVAERSSLKLLTMEKPQSLVEEIVVNRVEVEKTRIVKKIEQREMKPVTQEKINHGTKYIKIPQNLYTDEVVDVTVAIQKQFHLMQTMHRVGEGNLTSDFGLDLRYSESAY